MSFAEKLKQTNKNALVLFNAAPETMRAFQSVMRAAASEGALSKRAKELMALAIAVHSRCEGCIVFHVSAAIAHGASRDEVSEALAVAVEMGGGPAAVYAGSAIAAFDELKGKAE